MESQGRFAAGLLRHGARAYATMVVEALADQSAGLSAHGLPSSFADPIEDTRVRLLTLAEALDVDRPELIARQIAWYKVAFAHRNVAGDYLEANLHAIRDALLQQLPAPCHEIVMRHLDAGVQMARNAPSDLPSHLESGGAMLTEARQFLLAVLENRAHDALDLVMAWHAAGASIAELHDHVLTRAQREVGRMWLMAEIPIADEHFASRLVERCLDRLAGLAPPAIHLGRFVVTCAVGGNLHDIGLRMVADRFEMHGWDAWHLGADMPAHDFEWLLQDRRVDLIALGATLVLHVSTARSTIERLRATLGTRCPPILVGGHPFTLVEDLYRVIGADAVAHSAAEAVAYGESLTRG